MNAEYPDVKAQLEAWRQSQLHDLVLPSGLAVKAKQVSLMDLLMQGAIPDTLSGFVQEALNSKKDEDGNPIIKVDGDNLPQMMGMFNVVTRACIVSPPLADEPGDGHLGINELQFSDKETIFKWANGEASALEPFREQSGEPAAAATPALHGEDVQPSSE